MDIDTYFNQRIINKKPERVGSELPSAHQIGDEIEIVLKDMDIIPGFIFAVNFAGDGAVRYDIAVPIATTSHYAVITNIRGSVRLKGENKSADELELISMEKLEPLIKRNLFHVVKP